MLVCQGYLYGIEVLSLDILHESHLHDALIADGTDVSRYCLQSSQLRGSPPAFSRNNLKPVVIHLPERDRLDDSYLSDTCGKLPESLFVKLTTRLVRICLNLFDCYLVDGRRPLWPHPLSGDESVKSSAQSVIFLVYCHCYFSFRNHLWWVVPSLTFLIFGCWFVRLTF